MYSQKIFASITEVILIKHLWKLGNLTAKQNRIFLIDLWLSVVWVSFIKPLVGWLKELKWEVLTSVLKDLCLVVSWIYIMKLLTFDQQNQQLHTAQNNTIQLWPCNMNPLGLILRKNSPSMEDFSAEMTVIT